jgi:hypothetical protein
VLFRITLSASSGQAVERTFPAFIQFVSTRAIRDVCGLLFRPAAFGSLRMAARAGYYAAYGMRAEYAPPEQTHDPVAQDVHRLVQCPAAPQRM